MGLVDILLATQETRGPSCTVALMLESLPKKWNRAEVEEAIANPLVRFSTLSQWTQRDEQVQDGVLKVQAGAFSRHRKRECACGRAR